MGRENQVLQVGLMKNSYVIISSTNFHYLPRSPLVPYKK
jgi:hypothetical protein